MKRFLLLLAVIVVVYGSEDEWMAFKKHHGKKYNANEEQNRQKNFNSNKARIDSHNKRHAQGLESFRLGVNEYSDMHPDEFNKVMNGYRKSNSTIQHPQVMKAAVLSVYTEVAAIDWRSKGAVTPVKNQTPQCNSCYAFAAAGSLEGQYFRKTGRLVPLSVQNIVDCSSKFGNRGCIAGNMVACYKYIAVNKGIDTGAYYPYMATVGSCRYSPNFIGATAERYVRVRSGSEAALQWAVANVGPVSVAIDASGLAFQQYRSGIYYNPQCSTTRLNHAVLVVGYGTENGTDYWLVKNSYGTTWGEQGYIRILRNRNNHCGIATDGSYPVV